MVAQIRKACREPRMAWCEQHAVDYVLGFTRNQSLRRNITKEMRQAGNGYKEN
jgi:hypothetical protein